MPIRRAAAFLRKINGPIPIYPFLFSVYPVLYLWSANRNQEPVYVIIPSLVVTLALTAVLFIFCALVLRGIQRGAVISAVLAFYVLSYNQLTASIGKNSVNTRQIVFACSLLLILGLSVFLATRKFDYSRLALLLNLVSLILVLLSAVPTIFFYIQSNRVKATVPQQESYASIQSPAGKNTPPDVYFILMDAYGRQDFLKNDLKFDNRDFVDALKQRGLIFPDCALGNYPSTSLAIASILNMDYLDKYPFTQEQLFSGSKFEGLTPYIQNNEAFARFRALGYKIVTFRGYMPEIDLQNVDTYVDFEKDASFNQRLETQNFQALYFRTTLLFNLYEKLHLDPQYIQKHAPEAVRQLLPSNDFVEERFLKIHKQNVYAVETLKKLPGLVDSPKLVYAHLYAAHWPYMIRPDGSLRLPFNEAETVAGYLDGIRYLNDNMLGVVDDILKNSKTPPVIILQSDHSYGQDTKVEWSGEHRNMIFSAYYLPGGGDQLLYPSISPVNNFRLVLKYYLREPIDLLPDTSYYVRGEDGQPAVHAPSCISTARQ